MSIFESAGREERLQINRVMDNLRGLYETPAMVEGPELAIDARKKVTEFVQQARASGRTLLNEFEGSTCTRRPSMVIASPRRGRRPKRCRTSPPTVSKSASE